MAAFNPKDPRHQREQQRAAAKRSMGPQRLARADVGEISGRHAGYQLGRQQQFRGLALYGDMAKLRHESALAGFENQSRLIGLRESALRDQKKGLNFSIASGLVGTGLGVLEGKRREKILQRDLADQQLMRTLIETNLNRRRFQNVSGPFRALGGR